MKPWGHWQEYWQAAVAAWQSHSGVSELEARGQTFPRYRVDGPASPAQVAAVQSELGFALPRAFRTVLTQFSQCVDVAWQFPHGFKPPPPFAAIFAGQCNWSLSRLLEIDEGRRSLVSSLFDDTEDPYDAVWHDKLASAETGHGDYLAIDLAIPGREPVVYLRHDGWPGHGYELGKDFIDFIDRWSLLGFPGPEQWQWEAFAVDATSYLDPHGEKAIAWRDWFGLGIPVPPTEPTPVRGKRSAGKSKGKKRPAGKGSSATTASAKRRLEVVTNSLGARLVLIPPGEFLMGVPRTEPRIPKAEKPRHKVRITCPFYLGACQVTQAEYQQVMGTNPSQSGTDERCPVDNVTWHEAIAFCNRLSESENLPPYYDDSQTEMEEDDVLYGDGSDSPPVLLGPGYRLPTEAEWEYACRAGTESPWYFGSDADDMDRYAWYTENTGRATHPVGQKKPNAFGLFDIYGNVSEWCWDFFADEYYADSPTEDPSGPRWGVTRVLRGGSRTSHPMEMRSASRRGRHPARRFETIGFRIARSGD